MDQSTRVRVLRGGENLPHRPHLHDFTGIHHRHMVCHARNHAKIVRNKKHGQLVFFPQVAQQIQNLGLDGYVQRRGGLVGNQQTRAD